MASELNARTSRRRNLLVGGAMLAWIAVVVVGAGRTANDSLLGVDNLEVVWIIVMGLAAIFGIVVLVMINPFSEFKEPEKRPSRGIGPLLFFALLLVVWRPSLLDNFMNDDEEQEAVEEADPLDSADPSAESAAETVAQASDVLLLIVALGAAGGLWFFLKRQDHEEVMADATHDAALESDLSTAIEAASAELATGTDPRTAVLNAYARLEAVLADHGSKRAKSETPTEHLRRSLQHLRIDSSPLVQLGALYEIARFSKLPVDIDDQRAAAQALDRARAELARLS